MTKGKILLVSYHFYPSREVGAKRPSETALHLMRSGYDVTVLRGFEPSFEALASPSSLEGLDVVSVTIPKKALTALWIKLKTRIRGEKRAAASDGMWTTGGTGGARAPKLTLLGWLRRQVLAWDTLFQGNKRWLLKSVLKLVVQTRGTRFDLVIASGPPMVSYIGGWALAVLKRARLILDYRDPWYVHGDPELSTVMLGHPLANFENRLARTCAQRCSVLVAASPGTRRHILEHFDVSPERVDLVRNGFDEHAVVDAPPPKGRLEILYAGSLYWNRNPFPFLEALYAVLADGALKRNAIRCRLVGNCEEWKGVPLRPWIAAKSMRDVIEIVPFMSPAELRDVVAGSNVLVNFAQGQKRQIPAKSYDYIAARRDVLVITEPDSDVADLFREAGVGTIVAPDDTAGFAAAIKSLYAKHVDGAVPSRAAPNHAVRPYSRAAQLELFTKIVARVLEDADTSS
jgi:glycosyltransferase involved in cell wall biosynthesis